MLGYALSKGSCLMVGWLKVLSAGDAGLGASYTDP